MEQFLFKYYGVDWLGTLLMIGFLVSIGAKKRNGFLYGMAGNIVWLIFGIQTESIASIAVCAIQFFLNLRAYYMWKEDTPIPVIQQPYCHTTEDISMQALQKEQWQRSVSVN